MAESPRKDTGRKIICMNRRARFDYTIGETIEAGLVLQGTEVKSLRDGKADLKDSYADIQNGEIFLLHAHIHEYEQGNRFNHDPVRPRKLLLHKREIARLLGKTREKGLTLIPTRMYFSHGKAKVELGLAKGKKQYDKREDVKRRSAQRDIERALAGE
ncbi:MAG: SsrA-binding protein SmpB [Candidatus Tectomicrobia bacterium]|uniref:SsrA-binding protein n=1 Tax=Tectimicrobiota bacterium TaxID=2528274 RepID=A0A937W821_UNCTE|nr:SsrA-binding protein SmpB [Candidatus Tectomicrobia bacterium]